MKVYYLLILNMFLLFGVNYQINVRHTGSSKQQLIQNGIKILVVSILALVAGLRYNVGTDYYNYYISYEFFKTSPLVLNDEPGIKIIARIASYIFDEPATMMFLAAVITVVLMTVTIIQNSDIYWISIILYIFLGCWHGCFNGVRQYLAAAILFAGHHLIKEKNFFKWCVIVFFASMFHITAIVGILFYFFSKTKISIKQVVISFIVIYFGIQAYDLVFNFIGFLKSETFDFEGVGAGYLTNSINLFRILVAWVPVLFFWIFNKYYDKENDKFRFYMNMTFLHAILMTAAMNSTYLGRVGIYTGIYNTLTWPLLIDKVESRSKKILIGIMMIFYFLYWRTEAMGPSLNNFQWIFQR